MVFYGTETSPGGEHEDDEDLKITENKALENAAGIISSNEDDPQHNAVEPVTGGQWKDVHKVESPDLTHNEVLRTTTENDVSSSSAGCLALSKKGQHCIEVALDSAARLHYFLIML
ncbi:hypothetical protein C0J52_15497 [Blattella germanica]|nr:hypothetical protein C0J52_15497 [Blattella germanica]